LFTTVRACCVGGFFRLQGTTKNLSLPSVSSSYYEVQSTCHQ